MICIIGMPHMSMRRTFVALFRAHLKVQFHAARFFGEDLPVLNRQRAMQE